MRTGTQWQNVVSTISHMCDIVDTMFCHCGSVTLCYTRVIKGWGVLFTAHEENKGPITVHEDNKSPITVHEDNKHIYSTRVVNS